MILYRTYDSNCGWRKQVAHVDMEICIVKGMGLTPQLLALPCSTMAWAVGLAMRCGATMTPSGASLGPSLSLQQTSVHQIWLFQTTMADGATLPCNTLILRSLPSCRLHSTGPELFQSHSEGEGWWYESTNNIIYYQLMKRLSHARVEYESHSPNGLNIEAQLAQFKEVDSARKVIESSKSGESDWVISWTH